MHNHEMIMQLYRQRCAACRRYIPLFISDLAGRRFLIYPFPFRDIERPEKCPVDIFHRDGADMPVVGGPRSGSDEISLRCAFHLC